MRSEGLKSVSRLPWLDITRLGCAVLILGIHWLRACYKVGLLAYDPSTTLLLNYQSKSGGVHNIPFMLVAGYDLSFANWTANAIGFLGEFGWTAVSTFVLLSGFSLTFASVGPTTAQNWLNWFRKRAVRLLVPYYLTAIPFLSVFILLFALTGYAHDPLTTGLHAKMLTIFNTPLLGIVTSHILLFNPYQFQGQPTFFAPAWWFIPAILVAYLFYPATLRAIRSGRTVTALIVSAGITFFAFTLSNAKLIVNENWYYIALQESFNFTLGVAVGYAWRRGKQVEIERFLFARWTPVLGIGLFYFGNLLNWSSSTRPIANLFYGPGLALALIGPARKFEKDRFLAALRQRVDAYDLYLVHQPFAFPIALVMRSIIHEYATFVGWFIFVPIAALASIFLANATRYTFARCAWLRFENKIPQ